MVQQGIVQDLKLLRVEDSVVRHLLVLVCNVHEELDYLGLIYNPKHLPMEVSVFLKLVDRKPASSAPLPQPMLPYRLVPIP
jgi:hypothetical protein